MRRTLKNLRLRWGRLVRHATAAGHARLLAVEARATDARGQTTVEYALVMLGVAAVAGLLLTWVRGTDLFERLFDKILKSVTP